MPETIDQDQKLDQLKARIDELFEPWIKESTKVVHYALSSKEAKKTMVENCPEYQELLARILEYLLHSPEIKLKELFIELGKLIQNPSGVPSPTNHDYSEFNDRVMISLDILEDDLFEGLRAVAREAILKNPSGVHDYSVGAEGELLDTIADFQRKKITDAVGAYFQGPEDQE